MNKIPAAFRKGRASQRRNLVLMALLTVGGSGGTMIARACLSGQFASVHFNSGMPDFGTPPRRGVAAWRGELASRLVHPESYAGDEPDTELTPDRDQNQKAAANKEQTQRLDAGRRFEQAGKWREAKREYETLAQKQGWTGTLRDRVEILTRLAAGTGSQSAAFLKNVQDYFASVAASGSFASPEATAAQLDLTAADPAADWLRERARYQAACVLAETGETKQAIERFTALRKDLPQGAKREDTLIMLARTALLPADEAKRDLTAGTAALDDLTKAFPKTRYRNAVRGLRARVHFLQNANETAAKEYLALGDLDSVELVRKKLTGKPQEDLDAPLLSGYLKRLANAAAWGVYSHAIQYIDLIRKRMSAPASRQFAQNLQSDPELASAYLYYRLYHTRSTTADLKNLTLLADTLAARYPGTKLPPFVRVRLAEVYYQRGSYERALPWLDGAETPATRDRVLYVRGAVRQKMGQNAAARRDFAALLARCPESTLRRTARENLAILLEAAGDRPAALEQYFALNYQSDIAFLLDIRLTTGEIERYAQTHTDKSQRDLLAYSLGIRYLRDERWREAETWLRRVTPAKYAEYSKGRQEGTFSDKPSPAPLVALKDLSRLYRAINAAVSNDDRAAALFAYASYYSTHGTLLLYNPALWNGSREYSFELWWNTKQATAEDTAAVRNYMFSHEVYSRSRRICLELARRYPKSPAAPAALYRAACASRRLANFNTWWDAENRNHNYWDEASRLMTRLAATYPKSPKAAHARKYAKVFQDEKKINW